MTLAVLTAFTLVAFAANSLLCRMALGGQLVDPVSFTTLRLVSAAVALIPIARLAGKSEMAETTAGSWRSGLTLFAYAAAFSLAYVWLDTGTGALILFGSVQITMLGAALKAGERLRPAQWIGLVIATGGLLYLLLPGISAPAPLGALLMCVAGLAWGLYSIEGKEVSAPVAMTAANFLRTVPMALAVSALAIFQIRLEPSGILLALISGVITSGLGYVLWYKVLPSLSRTQASILQLVVPVLAALGGVAFLSEVITIRLVAASMLVLGGVALAVLQNREGPHDG